MNPFEKRYNLSRRWLEAYDYVENVGDHPPSPYTQAILEGLSKAIPEGRLEKIPRSPCKRLLDVGCGSGVVGIYCLVNKLAEAVTLNDIAPDWITIARENVNMWKPGAPRDERGSIDPSKVRYFKGKFESIPEHLVKEHDLIVFNPPQLVGKYASADELSKIEADNIEKTFRLAGPDGLDIAREFFQWYETLSKPAPAAVILLSSFHGKDLIERTIKEHGLGYEIVHKHTALLRKAFHAAAKEFTTKQLSDKSLERLKRPLKWNEEQEWTEDLLTISLRHGA